MHRCVCMTHKYLVVNVGSSVFEVSTNDMGMSASVCTYLCIYVCKHVQCTCVCTHVSSIHMSFFFYILLTKVLFPRIPHMSEYRNHKLCMDASVSNHT